MNVEPIVVASLEIGARACVEAAEHDERLEAPRDPGDPAADAPDVGEDAPPKARKPRARRTSRLCAVAPDDAVRPIVVLGTDVEQIADAAIDALASEARLYRRGDALVTMRDSPPLPLGLVHRDGDPATIVRLAPATVTEWISTAASVIEPGEPPTPVRPPAWLTETIIARGAWPQLRHLEAVCETPVLLADGTVHSTPGYDARTGLYLSGSPLDVPAHPTAEDVRQSLDLLGGLVAEFPFRGLEHRSAWLACVMTPLARYAFGGAAPLYLFDASAAGTGKTLLASVACVIGTARALALDALPTSGGAIDEAELRKMILAFAIAGRRVVALDNVDDVPLAGAELARVITATTVGGRVLGASRDWTGPITATWIATGNNVEVAGDLYRRICHVRLESPDERPEDRGCWRIPNLEAHVREHRPALTRAALVVLRAYCDAGRPAQPLTPWGSFDGWGAIVRAAISWAGWPDPAETRTELRRASATRGETERAVIRGWVALVRDGHPQGLTVRAALNLVRDAADGPAGDLRAALVELVPDLDPGAVGRTVRGLRGRLAAVEGGTVAIDATGTARGGVQRWGISEQRQASLDLGGAESSDELGAP